MRSFMQVLRARYALAGCAALPAPRNLQDSLAYGYATLALARFTAAQALERGTVSLDEARRVQRTADAARAGLDAAMSAHEAGDASAALARLQLVSAALAQLEAFLKERK